MTEQNLPYGTPPPPQAYGAALKKPPLPAHLKRTASVAGAVSFTVMSIGWGLLSTAVGIGLLASILPWVLDRVSASGAELDADYFRLVDFIDTINPEAWIIPLVIAGIVGAGLWVLSLFISRRMLARAQHPSPWGVTWAGAGIAIAASWVVSWVAWLPLQFAGFITPAASTGFEGFGITIVLAIVSIVFSLATSAALGWLAWWWMAHALRPAVPTA